MFKFINPCNPGPKSPLRRWWCGRVRAWPQRPWHLRRLPRRQCCAPWKPRCRLHERCPGCHRQWGFHGVSCGAVHWIHAFSYTSWYFLPGSNPSHASSYTSTGASHGDANGWRDPMGTGNTDWWVEIWMKWWNRIYYIVFDNCITAM